MDDALLVSMMLEYMYNTYNRYEKDLSAVKERIRLYDVTSDNFYDLVVCSVRLDVISSEFRRIRQLLDVYGRSE